MRKKLIISGIGCCLSMSLAQLTFAQANIDALTQLGKQVFFDEISNPEDTQACVSCHAPNAGWTFAEEAINQGQVVAPGADDRAGNRRPPTVSYSSFSPNFTSCESGPARDCEGGLFWDGRATGEVIGEEVFDGDSSLNLAYSQFLGPAADQALGPFANPVEQNVAQGDTELPGAEAVCNAVASAPYADLYVDAWGLAPDCTPEGADISFKRIALSIAAWEHSDEVNSFSSARDIALSDDADSSFPLDDLTSQENEGHSLFFGTARCSFCHNGVPAEDSLSGSGNESRQLYTDMKYHHLGLPPNPEAANFDPNRPDTGLAEVTGDPQHEGFIKTPSLRNIDRRPTEGFTKAYMHNGYFKRLEDVVHFYNTAAVKDECELGATAAEARQDNCWPTPELDNGLQASNFGAFGNLGLSSDQEAALVAYLRTLSDTLEITPPDPIQTNRAPTANDLTSDTLENTEVNITLTGSDPDGDALTFALASEPSSGSLTLSGNVATYLPNANFVGSDNFQYQVCDPSGNCANAVVTLNILPADVGSATNANFSAAFSDWGNGYCVTLRVHNDSAAPVSDWSVEADLGASRIFTSWNGNFSSQSGLTTIKPGFSWNRKISAGGTQQSIGFCAFRNNPSSRVLPRIISSAP